MKTFENLRELAVAAPQNAVLRNLVRNERVKKPKVGHVLFSSMGSSTRAKVDYAPQCVSERPLVQSSASTVRGPVGGFLKRSFDVTFALSAVILMSPIMIAIAALIFFTMGGPIIFKQQRVGYGRSTFRCFKFRTMVPDAQERLLRYLADDARASHNWQTSQKLKADPRITWLGHILRRSSLDELPQLFNVLRGDMSCIGPRPVLSSELEDRYGVHAKDYARAKPGLTGIWQVSGRNSTTYAHRINCDRYYVRRWSFVLDLVILLRTIPAVLRFKDTA